MGKSEIKFDISNALFSLTPTANWFVRNGILNWNDKEVTQPSQSEIDAEIKRLQDEYDAQAYARARQPLYPDIGDQLDDLYHKGAFSAEMKAKIKKVKDDNPKPE